MVISPASSPNAHLKEGDFGEMFAVCSAERKGWKERQKERKTERKRVRKNMPPVVYRNHIAE